MSSEDILKAQALIAGWYWQPAEAKNARYQYAIRTFTRYYECAPVAADSLKLILEYLRSEDVPATGELSVLGKSVGGFAGYKAKEAWYQTSPSDTWEGTQSQKIRIYQTFYHAAESSDADGPYTVENGCQYSVTHTFYWNCETLPTLSASTSGVEYTMQGVTRDAETGLFSCVVECKTRVRQDVALYRQGGTVFETVSDEQHIGVKASEVDAAGQPASAGGGVIVTRKITKNPDCTSTVENTVTTETPVAGATVEYRKTLRGSTTTTVNRNQSAALDGTGLAVGEVRRSEKTDGGLWNNSTTTQGADPAGTIVKDCTKTAFEHQDATTVNQTDAPSSDHVSEASGGVIVRQTSRKTDEGNWDVQTTTTTETPVTGATVEYRKTLRGSTTTTVNRNQSAALDGTGLAVGEVRRSEKTDGGLWNNSTTVTGTDPAGEIMDGCSRSPITHTDTSITNVKDKPSVDQSAPAANVEVVKRARKTDENNWDVEEQTTTYSPNDTGTVTQGSAVQKVETKYGINQTTVPNPGQGAVNVVKQVSATPNEHGSFTVSEQTTTHQPQTSGVKTWTDDNGRTYEAISYRNQPEPILPSGGGSSSASFHMNDHGSYDGGYQKQTSSSSNASGSTVVHHTVTADKYQLTKVPGGKTKVRKWVVTFDVYGGTFNNVFNHVFSNGTVKDYPWLGCYSHVEGGGNNAIGYRYTSAVNSGHETTLEDSGVL